MRIKRLILFLLLPMPSFLKVAFYRVFFKYEIAKDVRIGFSLVDASTCTIGRGSRIGHLNFISSMKALRIGENAVIGHLNLILGGDLVDIGDEAMIVRFNEINSIINPINSNPADPRLLIGKGAIVTAWHKIDFTDRVEIGESTIIAGRNSNLWTHNRQQVRPLRIGRNCYVGSGVQMVPGSSIGSYCVVGLGSVITKAMTADSSLIAGVPARVVKPLGEDDRALVEFTTRPDLAAKKNAQAR